MPSEYGPEFDAFAARVRAELVPKIEETACFVSLTPESPDKVDVKFAVELGLAVMLDKPIVALVPAGTKVPAKLAAVADRVVELDRDAMASTADRLQKVIRELVDEGVVKLER